MEKSCNKVAYCLLAFFLGGFGLHKFYAGQKKFGIMYLVFCWTGIPEILGVIDCIRGILKKSDENGMITF